jgi:hypothetical protein
VVGVDNVFASNNKKMVDRCVNGICSQCTPLFGKYRQTWRGGDVNNLSINQERDLISTAIIRTYKLDYRHFNRLPSREVQLGYRIIALLHNITAAQ